MVNEKDNKQGLIIQKAWIVFGDKDYQRATIDEIATLAGVGKGTVYRYFHSKEELFLELLQQADHARQKVIMENISKMEDLRGKLGRLLIGLLRFTKNQPQYFKILTTDINNGQPQFLQEVRRIQSNHQEIVFQILQEGIKQNKFRDVNPLITSVYICKLIEGALQIFTEELNYSEDQIVLTMLDLIWNGLSKR